MLHLCLFSCTKVRCDLDQVDDRVTIGLAGSQGLLTWVLDELGAGWAGMSRSAGHGLSPFHHSTFFYAHA